MVISASFFHNPVSLKYDLSAVATKSSFLNRINQNFTFAVNGVGRGRTRWDSVVGSQQTSEWSFMSGSKISLRPRFRKLISNRSSLGVYASWWTSSQIASNVFTLGTAAVLPFYSLMVVAPKAKLTRKCMESSIPYILLGLLYGYLLYLSWTPETIKLMFASKYWLPELSGIARMFSNEMTLASAWIHLLAVDLFAARQVYHDGLRTEVETRHSVSLCLLFSPLGIVTHFVTKKLTKKEEILNKPCDV